MHIIVEVLVLMTYRLNQGVEYRVTVNVYSGTATRRYSHFLPEISHPVYVQAILFGRLFFRKPAKKLESCQNVMFGSLVR